MVDYSRIYFQVEQQVGRESQVRGEANVWDPQKLHFQVLLVEVRLH